MVIQKQLCYKTIVASSQFGGQILKRIQFSDDGQSILQERIRNRYQRNSSKLKSLREYCSKLSLDKSLSKTLSEYVDGIIGKQKGLKTKVMNAINKVIVVTKILTISSILKIKQNKFNQRKAFYFIQGSRIKSYKPNTRKRSQKLKKFQEFVIDQINQSIEHLKEGQLSNQCIKEILLPFANQKVRFYQQIKMFKVSITNFFFSNSAFYLNIESYLYEFLNNALILLNQSLEICPDDQLSLIYFQLVVVILKNICQNDLYILTYDMCKSCDKLIKKFSQAAKELQFYDKLMLSYHYYRGFSQTNFDEKHKFQDYIICKQFFFKLLYKKYPQINLKQIQKSENDLSDFDSYKQIQEQAQLIFNLNQNKSHYPTIKKYGKDQTKKKQIKETEQSFFENFFLCYLFFRQESGSFGSDGKHVKDELINQCLLINKKNPKFDLGVQQIYKCFTFQDDWLNGKKQCLKMVREQMKNEKLININNCNIKTIYEKYIDLTEDEKKKIPNNNSSNLHKYLKHLAEIYIYNNNPIQFLNIWRCLSILQPENYYINYILYLEQLNLFTYNDCYSNQDRNGVYDIDKYNLLIKDLQDDINNQSQQKQIFWDLTYQQLQERFKQKSLQQLPLNISKDSPIVSIRKIMNNILLEIQQSIDQQENLFKKIFECDYAKFKQRQEEKKKNLQKFFKKNEKPRTSTEILNIKNKQAFIKVYELDSKIQIKFSLEDYRFVQEVAICIYLREKQHQKYLPFQKNIGYHSINRYIYHFIYDKHIFLVLEYYPIDYQQILSNKHFRCQDKYDYIQEDEQKIRSQASSISSIKSYQTDQIEEILSASQELSISGFNFTSSDEQRQRNISDTSELSSISVSNSKNEDFISASFSSSIQFSKERRSYTPNFQKIQKQRITREFTKKDLFICMLRIEQIFEVLKDNNLLHKDIKLLNLVWRETDEPILIDFGITELYQNFSYYMNNNGTLPYQSYQQSVSCPINENTDLTSFIIVIYELARGEKIDLGLCKNLQKASYISNKIKDELKDMFSRDFINLIETVVDCQLDTIKSRAKYFMWQKFEIFMNLLYECQKKNIQVNDILHYQDFYVQIKKALKRAVQKKKCKLDVEFDLNLLINLKYDPTFQMLISLQSHDILKHYESLLYIIINKQKMEEFKLLIKKNSLLNSSSFTNDSNLSDSFLNEESQKKNCFYSLKNEHLKIGIQCIYESCQNEMDLECFSQSIVDIFNSDHIKQNLNQMKYKFDIDKLVKLFQEYNSLENQKIISKNDQNLLNKIFIKLIQCHYKQQVFEELALHIEQTEKSIINFQTKTSEKIIEAYNRTDEIRVLIQDQLQNKSVSKIQQNNLLSSLSQSQEQQQQQQQAIIQLTSQTNELSISAINANQDNSPSDHSVISILRTYQPINFIVNQDEFTYKSISNNSELTNSSSSFNNQIINMNELTQGQSFPSNSQQLNNQTNTNQTFQVNSIQVQSQQIQQPQNNQIGVDSTSISLIHTNNQHQVSYINQTNNFSINITLNNSSQSSSVSQNTSNTTFETATLTNNPQISNIIQQQAQQNLNQIIFLQQMPNQQMNQNTFNQTLAQQAQNNKINCNNDSSISSLGIDISSIDKSQNSSINNQSIKEQQQIQQGPLNSSLNNSSYNTKKFNNSNSSQNNQNNTNRSLGNYSNNYNMSLILYQNQNQEQIQNILIEQERDDVNHIQGNYSQNNSYEQNIYDFSIKFDQIDERERTRKNSSIKHQRVLQKQNNKNNKSSSQNISIK
ncbi:hypothetical protein ABPG72_016267 [Tetrahymena utriculariae]